MLSSNFTQYDELSHKCRHHLDLYGLQFFKPSEFEHFELMNPVLLCMLEAARIELGKPIYITSSYRTPMENKSVGGAVDSSHLSGDAVDIACYDSAYRFSLLSALLKSGFRRLGVYPNHIHVDVKQMPDNMQMPPIIWYGKY